MDNKEEKIFEAEIHTKEGIYYHKFGSAHIMRLLGSISKLWRTLVDEGEEVIKITVEQK